MEAVITYQNRNRLLNNFMCLLKFENILTIYYKAEEIS